MFPRATLPNSGTVESSPDAGLYEKAPPKMNGIFLKYGFGDQAMRRMAEKNRSLQLRGTESTLLHRLVWVSTNPR